MLLNTSEMKLGLLKNYEMMKEIFYHRSFFLPIFFPLCQLFPAIQAWKTTAPIALTRTVVMAAFTGAWCRA